MVRLKDIAVAAGVSTGTVSAALAGRGQLRESTRREIRRLAEQMNYQPNAAALLLRSKPAVDVGMLIADQQTMFVSEFASWCNRYSLRHQIEMTSSRDHGNIRPSLLQNQFAKGVLHTGYLGPQVLRFLEANPHYPFVTLNEDSRAAVSSDFLVGVHKAIQYLIALGHHDIYASAGDQEYAIHRQISLGIDAAAEEFHFRLVPEKRVFSVRGRPPEETMRGYIEYARALLSGDRRPTALFCSLGVSEARAFIYVAQELGLSVPGDLSVVAVGGEQDSRTGYPFLSHVTHDYEALVAQAMLLLQRLIPAAEAGRPDKGAHRLLVEPKFVPSQSTARRK